MKTCSKCRKELPNESFSKLGKDRLQYYCKSCTRQYRMMKRNKKACVECKQILSKEKFYECRISEDGFFHTCKNCCVTDASNPSSSRNKKHYDNYLYAAFGTLS